MDGITGDTDMTDVTNKDTLSIENTKYERHKK